MPKGVYKRTQWNTPTAFKRGNKLTVGKHWKWSEERKDTIRGNKNVAKRLDVRQKLSRIKKGKMPKFIPTFKGLKHTDKYRKKMSKRLKGENHYNWKGGITSLRQQIRHLFEYRQWRSDIFTRDDFTCILCGQRGGWIEADHYPKRFSTIFHENKIKSLEKALNCEEFWNINNGRTLCWKCHHDKTKRKPL